MTITLSENASRNHKRRARKHGPDFEFVLEQFIKGKPAPFGLLLRSIKTGHYCWFDRKYVSIPFYDGEKFPSVTEGVDMYTDNIDNVKIYFDYLLDKKLGKRETKRFSPLYERAVNQQQSVVDILQNL